MLQIHVTAFRMINYVICLSVSLSVYVQIPHLLTEA